MSHLKTFILMASLFSFFNSCKSPANKINNSFLLAKAPKDYVDITGGEASDILVLQKNIGDVGSMLSIDNTPDNHLIPNSVTMQHFTPTEILRDRLKSIEEDTQQPDCDWQHFNIVRPPATTAFKNFKAAEAVFTVDENVYGKGKILPRKIKRMVVYVNNDIWNIIMAPSQTKTYEEEMIVLNEILESIALKKYGK